MISSLGFIVDGMSLHGIEPKAQWREKEGEKRKKSKKNQRRWVCSDAMLCRAMRSGAKVQDDIRQGIEVEGYASGCGNTRLCA